MPRADSGSLSQGPVLGNRLVSHSEAAYWPVCPQIHFSPSPALCLRGLTPAAALKWVCQREPWPVTGGRGQERHRYLLFFLCCEQDLWGRLSQYSSTILQPLCPVSVPTRWSSLTGSGNSTFSLRPSHPRSGSNCERSYEFPGCSHSLAYLCSSSNTLVTNPFYYIAAVEVPGMSLLGWNLICSLPDSACGWVGSWQPTWATSVCTCEGMGWDSRHITLLAGAGAVNWGAGATVVTAADRRAVGAVGPCCTGNGADLPLEKEGDLGSEVPHGKWLW